MKIGITTFWYTHENYGQLLQGYALKTYLESFGHEVFFVKYDKSKSISKNKSLSTKLKSLLKKVFLKLAGKSKDQKKNVFIDRGFDEFRDKHFKFSNAYYKTYEDLKNNAPQADVYIVGSDQVWNYVFIGAFEPFFLKFGKPETKRISYAASIGHAELPEVVADKYKELLKDFTAISVRESSGVKLFTKMGIPSVRLMPDPTFLLTKEEWAKLMPTKQNNANGKKNIFIYTLGNRPLPAKDAILEYIFTLPQTDIKHTSINHDNSGHIYPTIPEWLSLIDNADLVVTNSFHGVALSIALNTNFIAIPSHGNTKGMNERLESLLDKLNLSDHILYNFTQDDADRIINKPVNWSDVNLIVADWVAEAKEFLTSNIH